MEDMYLNELIKYIDDTTVFVGAGKKHKIKNITRELYVYCGTLKIDGLLGTYVIFDDLPCGIYRGENWIIGSISSIISINK
jgi:hypothetical protein